MARPIKDILEGNWKQISGQIQETWGELTDDEVAQIKGNWEQLVGKLQAKYGYTRARAEREANDFLARFED